ncbi:MAG: hypothetical protein R3F43_23850 [bacterium]
MPLGAAAGALAAAARDAGARRAWHGALGPGRGRLVLGAPPAFAALLAGPTRTRSRASSATCR